MKEENDCCAKKFRERKEFIIKAISEDWLGRFQ